MPWPCILPMKLVSLFRTIMRSQNETPADYTTPVLIWSVIELSLAVISACLPTLRPIFVRYKALSIKRGSPYSSYNSRTRRFGRDRYSRSNSKDGGKDFELPGIKPVDPIVHTDIRTSDIGRLPLPKEGVIQIEQSIEHV